MNSVSEVKTCEADGCLISKVETAGGSLDSFFDVGEGVMRLVLIKVAQSRHTSV